jgi:hypothetical protein
VKRYHVFAYDTYYPTGGWSDHAYSSDDRDDALKVARSTLESKYHPDHVEVVDLEIEQRIAITVWDPDPATVGKPTRRTVLVEVK